MKMRTMSCAAFLVLFFGGVLSAQEPQEFRIVGWNMQGNGSASPTLLSQQIAAKEDVDLWGLSEVRTSNFETFRQAAEDGGGGGSYEIIKGTTASNKLRLAIIFNEDRLEVLSSTELTDIQPSSGQRAPLVAHFRGRNTGQEFLFMVNHLARGDEDARHEQSQLLNEWGQDQILPVIATGDYNYDYDIDDGAAGNRDEGFDLLTEDDVFHWLEPLTLVRTEDSNDDVLDFVFIVNRDTVPNWSGMSRILNRSGDSVATVDNFSDTTQTTDHRPVDAVLSFNPSVDDDEPGEPEVEDVDLAATLRTILERLDDIERRLDEANNE